MLKEAFPPSYMEELYRIFATATHLLNERAHMKSSQRSLLCWFDDHCVPTCQSRGDLPNKHNQWEVPLKRQHEKSQYQ